MMRLKLALALSCSLSFSAAAQMITPTVAPGREPAEVQRIEGHVANLSKELAAACPFAESNNQPSYDLCRMKLYQDSLFRRSLVDFVLWGRQRDPNMSLRESSLTQFGPDVFTGMYISLFMFNGKHRIEYVESEKLYRVTLNANFRNRLAPGQFPYPFWHEDAKWTGYQDAKSIILYLHPETMKTRIVQFTPFGVQDPDAKVVKIPKPDFDGKWLWTDASGKTQPQVTLFDGLFSAENPNMSKLDASYKEFALSLRAGTCMACHVPNNPDKMKRLILLQTPAHAAAEIKRVVKSVTNDKMPYDDYGVEYALKGEIKGPLLERAKAFEAVVEAARAWEADKLSKLETGTVKP
jgi:hypothetical protein